MFTKLKIIALTALLLITAPAFAQNAKLDLNGTPMLLATAANSLVIGIETTGFLRLDTGTGAMQIPKSFPADGTAATVLAGSGTIDSTIGWQREVPAGAVTGIIIEAGAVHGQILRVTNDKDAGGTITFAAEATSNVCNGTAGVIGVGETGEFIWDATDTCWSANADG